MVPIIIFLDFSFISINKHSVSLVLSSGTKSFLRFITILSLVKIQISPPFLFFLDNLVDLYPGISKLSLSLSLSHVSVRAITENL